VLAKNPAAVIETGGGLAADPQTLPLLLEGSLAVWVRASPEEHMQRVIDQGDLRPMARSREAMRELKDILAAREPFYRQAHLHLNTSGRTVEQSFTELIEMIEQRKMPADPYDQGACAAARESERDQAPAIARHHQTPRASSSRIDRPVRKR
jgi:shikimate kinase